MNSKISVSYPLLLCCAISFLAPAPVVAQGTRADYERAMTLSKSFSNAIFRRSITPHWLAGNNAFWYRSETAPDRFQFVWVDALKGERRAAFDHQKLAAALAHELKKPVAADALPLSWIEPSRDGSEVHFRVDGQVWRFGRDGKLQPDQQDLNEEQLPALPAARPSRSGGDNTMIAFVNRTAAPMVLFWIDTQGKAQRYATVAKGATYRQNTYASHVWQVTDEAAKSLGIFEATNDETQAVIGEGETTNRNGEGQKPHSEPKKAPSSASEASTAPARGVSALVRDFNLWLHDAKTNADTPLTSNGSADNFYREPQVSPDGRFLVAMQVRPAQAHPVTLVEAAPPDRVQPKLLTIDYLKPGDRIEQERPRLFDLSARREIPSSDALFSHPWSISQTGWSRDGSGFRFLFNERGHQNLRWLEMDKSGKTRVLIDEHSDTFIDYSQKTYLHSLDKTDEFLWASERDGWNHLYLFDGKSATLKPITRGEWVMREVVRVDEDKRQIWFKALGIVRGQDPYYAHLARINFDGTGLKVLSQGDGTHSWKWSPDNRYFIDTFSRVDLAPQSTLRDAQSGKAICELEKADIETLLHDKWTMPERFAAKGRNGQSDIYGILVRPSNFDPAKKYPVIEQIYAGPQDFFVPKSFDILSGLHELAELGFIVVQIDGMGTNWRSKKFHDVCWKNLKDAGFPDRIAWMKAAAQTRPWLDLGRVGIYGGSAGGQSALGALLFFGDFYRVAAADCGCHDNRLDKIWWNEAWMGWPVDQSYEDSSNVVHAKNLRGDLLLIVGELDTNVDPASTMQVANALIRANKDFDLLVVPGAGHRAGGSAYGTRRQRDFFVRHLLDVEPPARNAA